LFRDRLSTAGREAFQTLNLDTGKVKCSAERCGPSPPLVVVLAWSTAMTVLGHLAAVVALLPSPGLLVQQFTAAAHG
jgi:hypothetical protein